MVLVKSGRPRNFSLVVSHHGHANLSCQQPRRYKHRLIVCSMLQITLKSVLQM